jgi:hypothetical protein
MLVVLKETAIVHSRSLQVFFPEQWVVVDEGSCDLLAERGVSPREEQEHVPKVVNIARHPVLNRVYGTQRKESF